MSGQWESSPIRSPVTIHGRSHHPRRAASWEHLDRRHPHASQELSDAERRIVRLLATDLTLREIGRELCLSLNTVKTHTHSIYRKLGVSSRAGAVNAGRACSVAVRADSTG